MITIIRDFMGTATNPAARAFHFGGKVDSAAVAASDDDLKLELLERSGVHLNPGLIPFVGRPSPLNGL